jgi:hypothetical protein
VARGIDKTQRKKNAERIADVIFAAFYIPFVRRKIK